MIIGRNETSRPGRPDTVGAAELRVFLWPALISLFIGLLSVDLSAQMPHWLSSIPKGVALFVAGIRGIAEYSNQPASVVNIMGFQWMFCLWYLAIWFGRFAPWESRIRAGTIKKATSLRPVQRMWFVVGYLILLAYLSGDVGLIGFPTLLNSRFAYPPTVATPILRPIYTSNVALMMYAWISPFCEATILWMFVNATLNFLDYVGLRRQ